MKVEQLENIREKIKSALSIIDEVQSQISDNSFSKKEVEFLRNAREGAQLFIIETGKRQTAKSGETDESLLCEACGGEGASIICPSCV